MAREVETLLGAMTLAAVFVFGRRLEIHRKGWRRASMSAGAGAAVAYVFVHLLPELSEAGRAFASATAHRAMMFAESRIYLTALIGFTFFYGLEHMVGWSARKETEVRTSADPILLLHIGGFALYGAMISYMMVRGIGSAEISVPLYVLAMALHFLSVDHSLLHEHGSTYLWPGRYILAAAVLAGWLCGIFVELPESIVFRSLGLISGGVIMNSMIMELPHDREGKFWPFMIGAAAYAAILLVATGIRGGNSI
jgi:hypothetical protein